MDGLSKHAKLGQHIDKARSTPEIRAPARPPRPLWYFGREDQCTAPNEEKCSCIEASNSKHRNNTGRSPWAARELTQILHPVDLTKPKNLHFRLSPRTTPYNENDTPFLRGLLRHPSALLTVIFLDRTSPSDQDLHLQSAARRKL